MFIIPPLREVDSYGSGYYQAPRGNRLHNGIDINCSKGSKIIFPFDGVITRIGYPYTPSDKVKGFLRYIEVNIGIKYMRLFYVKSYVEVGERIEPGQIIGETQGLLTVYPSKIVNGKITPPINDHFHLEVFSRAEEVNKRVYVDPIKFLKENGYEF